MGRRTRPPTLAPGFKLLVLQAERSHGGSTSSSWELGGGPHARGRRVENATTTSIFLDPGAPPSRAQPKRARRRKRPPKETLLLLGKDLLALPWPLGAQVPRSQGIGMPWPGAKILCPPGILPPLSLHHHPHFGSFSLCCQVLSYLSCKEQKELSGWDTGFPRAAFRPRFLLQILADSVSQSFYCENFQPHGKSQNHSTAARLFLVKFSMAEFKYTPPF